MLAVQTAGAFEAAGGERRLTGPESTALLWDGGSDGQWTGNLQGTAYPSLRDVVVNHGSTCYTRYVPVNGTVRTDTDMAPLHTCCTGQRTCGTETRARVSKALRLQQLIELVQLDNRVTRNNTLKDRMDPINSTCFHEGIVLQRFLSNQPRVYKRHCPLCVCTSYPNSEQLIPHHMNTFEQHARRVMCPSKTLRIVDPRHLPHFQNGNQRRRQVDRPRRKGRHGRSPSMPQRYVALRMADARALRGDYPRVRYASSDAPPPLSSGVSAFLPHAQSFAGSARSHRPPVRSSSDATGLYMVMALDGDEGEDGAVDVGGRGGEDEASSTDELSTEDALSLLGEEATARKRSTGHTAAGGDRAGGWVVAKESMFLVSAFLVLFTSGGLILGCVHLLAGDIQRVIDGANHLALHMMYIALGPFTRRS